MSHEALCGKDSLVVLVTTPTGGPGHDAVVRWCQKCGAVAIDLDVDGRTSPGAIMEMRFPDKTRWIGGEARIKAKYGDGGGQLVTVLGPPFKVEGQEWVPIFRKEQGDTEEELDWFKRVGLETP